METNYILTQTLDKRPASPDNRAVGDLERDGVVLLLPVQFDTYHVVFLFIFLHWMANAGNHPSVKLLHDYRLSISPDENEVCDAMMIILRCFAYQALGYKTVRFSLLLNENLQPSGTDVEVRLAKINSNCCYLAHKVELPQKLPFSDTITAYKNAAGASSWDSRVSLPISDTECVQIFLQSKLRLSGQNLRRKEVDHEYHIMLKWEILNPKSQMILIT